MIYICCFRRIPRQWGRNYGIGNNQGVLSGTLLQNIISSKITNQSNYLKMNLFKTGPEKARNDVKMLT
jgi:hypothetical protein